MSVVIAIAGVVEHVFLPLTTISVDDFNIVPIVSVC